MSAPRRKVTEHAGEDAGACGRCQAPIAAGQAVTRDATGRAHHHDCARRRVAPVSAEPLVRFKRPERPPVAHTCPGCGTAVAGDDDSVAVFRTVWHADCRQRHARGRR